MLLQRTLKCQYWQTFYWGPLECSSCLAFFQNFLILLTFARYYLYLIYHMLILWLSGKQLPLPNCFVSSQSIQQMHIFGPRIKYLAKLGEQYLFLHFKVNHCNLNIVSIRYVCKQNT